MSERLTPERLEEIRDLVGMLAPHNTWRHREAIRDLLDERDDITADLAASQAREGRLRELLEGVQTTLLRWAKEVWIPHAHQSLYTDLATALGEKVAALALPAPDLGERVRELEEEVERRQCCGNCTHWTRCLSLFGAYPWRVRCDWEPSKWSLHPETQEATSDES